MSYIQSVIQCDNCKKMMNVAFGIVGNIQIASWPKECPDCGAVKFTQIKDGWDWLRTVGVIKRQENA